MQNYKLTPKDFFIELGLTIALYAAMVSLIGLSFDIINHYFIDPLDYSGGVTYFNASSIRWAISMLIVLVPLNYVLDMLIRRDTIKNPARHDVWVRRWRIYLTIFLSGAAAIIDIIVILNTYLDGEISVRFIFKALVVLVLTGLLFWLCLLERQPTDEAAQIPGKMTNGRGLIRIILGVLALIGVVGGFIVAGSPASGRAARFDSQRVSDLSGLQSRVIEYWQNNDRLPTTLVEASANYAVVPVDPVTRAPYEYVPGSKDSKSNLNFSLCATFETESISSASGATDARGVTKPVPIDPSLAWQRANDVWDHSTGRVCFDRTIDPKLYPKIVK